jgi:hypothetical protein
MSKEKKPSCFVVMPYDGGDDIDAIIHGAAVSCGLEPVRGDRRVKPGRVLPQILRDIRKAAVVVADISSGNPNVFYELGIAHHVLGADRVVIITQSIEKVPFDLREFRVLEYKHTQQGRDALSERLPEALRSALTAPGDEEQWDVIRGCLPRTRLIVLELDKVLREAGRGDLEGITLRIIAGLGSMAISDREGEPSEAGFDPEYHKELLNERDKVRELLVRGARLKAVLNPPRQFAKAMGPDRLRARYRRLIGLLEGRSDSVGSRKGAQADVKAIGRCDFALTPVPMTNLFIIGDRVAFEGIKRGGVGGFEISHCETRPETVTALVHQFDRLFDESREEMLRGCPSSARTREHERKFFAEQLRAFYREATGEEPD